MKLSVVLIIGLVALGSPGVAESQGRGQSRPKNDDIPQNMRPPAGMCRIWLDDVPAARQPAPTDCASAVRNRPAKGRVIFGDDYVKGKKPDTTSTKGRPPLPVKGFAPGSSKTRNPLQRTRRP
jgi:hypothetical protein